MSDNTPVHAIALAEDSNPFHEQLRQRENAWAFKKRAPLHYLAVGDIVAFGGSFRCNVKGVRGASRSKLYRRRGTLDRVDVCRITQIMDGNCKIFGDDYKYGFRFVGISTHKKVDLSKNELYRGLSKAVWRSRIAGLQSVFGAPILLV